MKKHWKIILWITIPIVCIAVGMVLFGVYCNYAVSECRNYCYENIGDLPECDTALLLGAAKITPAGNPNLYFQARIDAAVQLFQAGKIKHILISGDNSREDYDEPTDMKNALLERGIPESAITLDYAGFRTLDSVIRAKEVFQHRRLLVITQPGHAERAVYIARRHDIEAIAFYAAEPSEYAWLIARNRKREKLAHIAAWIDVNILHRRPKFEQ